MKTPIASLTVGDIVHLQNGSVFMIDKIVTTVGNYIRVVAHDSDHVFQTNLNLAGSVDVWE